MARAHLIREQSSVFPDVVLQIYGGTDSIIQSDYSLSIGRDQFNGLSLSSSIILLVIIQFIPTINGV